MQKSFTHALIADLLATLEAEGQPFGIGAHLRVGELLQKLPEDFDPAHVKTLLSPILCSTKEEQQHFYEIFEKSWKTVESVGVLEPEEVNLDNFSTVHTRIPPWAILITTLVLMGLWGIGSWAGSTSQAEIPIAFLHVSSTVGDPETYIQIDSMAEKSQTPGNQRFSVEPLFKFSNKRGSGSAGIRLDTQNNRVFYRGLQEGTDTLMLRAHPHGWQRTQMWRHQIVFKINALPVDTIKGPDDTSNTAVYVQRPIPHPRDLSQFIAPKPTPLQEFLVAWKWPLKFAGMLLAGLLVWFAARLWANDRRKLIAEHRPKHKAPYAWSIQLKNPPFVDLGERFHWLLSQLRRREADEGWRLDVPRSIGATVAKGGIPHFRYSQQTRPSEYLLLIDRHSPRNHQAQLFDYMATAFRGQEVLLERFWYDGDPRLCWNEKYPTGLDLRSLNYYYPQSRLLVFGDAAQTLNPHTGQPAKWAAQTFTSWQDRAVLTPKPIQAWGRREHLLQEVFHVLPASLSALAEAVERFDSEAERDIRLDPKRYPDAAQESMQLIDNDLIKTLQHYFGDPLTTNHQFTRRSFSEGGSTNQPITNNQSTNLPIWIAACAVYPELHWDMTLYLGELLSEPNSQLLSSENLVQICRLPWFTTGEIPLEARKTLIAWLEKDHPDTLLRIREGIHRLLAQNPPPEESAAHDVYAMNMALNEYLYTKDSARKKELEKDILQRIAAGQAADFMVLKILEGPRSPEEFEVPENWRKQLKQKGLARASKGVWYWALPLWLLLCMGIIAWEPVEVGCKGTLAYHQDNVYCLQNGEQLVQYWEMNALEMVENSLALSAEEMMEGSLTNEADQFVYLILESGWKNILITSSIDSIQNDLILLKPGNKNVLEDTLFENHLRNYRMSMFVTGVTDDSLPSIDSIKCLQNLSTAYFNQGVTLRKEASDKACGFFLRAQELNLLLPDTAQLWFVRQAARDCSGEKNTEIIQKQLPNWVIKGELRVSPGRKLLTGVRPADIVITAKGLPYGYMVDGARFGLGIPGDWNSPVIATAIVPGYETVTITLSPEDFKSKRGVLTFYLLPNQRPPIVDRDNDGIPDQEDACPDVYGDKKFKGCPDPAPPPILADRDSDGVPDSEDKCPDERGLKENRGCPQIDDKFIQEKIVGFWVAEVFEENIQQKILYIIKLDGKSEYSFYNSDNTPRSGVYTSTWYVKNQQLREQNGKNPEVYSDIISFAENIFEIKIIDNGNPAYNGLIRKYRRIQSTDRDEDGVLDVVDNCPDEKGVKENAGCAAINKYSDYVQSYKAMAIREMSRNGIPASIILATAILQSDAGTNDLAARANNHFALKCNNMWKGDSYYKKDDDRDPKGQIIESCFRKYETVEGSYRGFSEFLRDKRLYERYGFLFNLERSDYKAWAKGLKSAGYSTVSDYDSQLIKIIERYDLNKLDMLPKSKK